MPKTTAEAVLLAALLAGSISGLPLEPERETGRESPKDEIGKPLAELAAGKRDPKTLRIEVMWVEGKDRTSATLFGNGVGIWNDRAQFRLSRPEMLSIASALKEARFGAMPSLLGQETDKLRLRGKIEVSIAGGTKRVAQLASGEQSEALSVLASRILRLAGERAGTGVTAASLAEALAKLSTGALASETLRLTALRRPEKPDAARRGWLLQLEGRQVLVRPFGSGGYGNQKRLELSDAEARSIFGALRESSPETLPSNLYASDYTEVRIEVLQWSRDLLARPSPNVTPETHGDRQKVFDRIVERLTRLEDRAEKEGREDANR